MKHCTVEILNSYEFLWARSDTSFMQKMLYLRKTLLLQHLYLPYSLISPSSFTIFISHSFTPQHFKKWGLKVQIHVSDAMIWIKTWIVDVEWNESYERIFMLSGFNFKLEICVNVTTAFRCPVSCHQKYLLIRRTHRKNDSQTIWKFVCKARASFRTVCGPY